VRVALDQAVFSLGGARLRVESDDPPLLDELAATLGRRNADVGPETHFGLSASVRTQHRSDGFADVTLEAPDESLLSPADFLLGFGAPDFPFALLPAAPPWMHVALAGETEPFLSLNGRDCQVRLSAGWRKAVALLLLHRLMRVRSDAIFFHASSVAIAGRAVLLVGPKGAGKSTLALELAGRGHVLLGDEHACYRPASREILPFRRPVGIKPGPRGTALAGALRRLGRSPERDGMMRLDADALFPGSEAAPAPLAAVIFLNGFAADPLLARLEPGRQELGRLQPVGSSLVNAKRTERVFQMTQLLASARVYGLIAGDPDATAEGIKEAIRA